MGEMAWKIAVCSSPAAKPTEKIPGSLHHAAKGGEKNPRYSSASDAATHAQVRVQPSPFFATSRGAIRTAASTPAIKATKYSPIIQ